MLLKLRLHQAILLQPCPMCSCQAELDLDIWETQCNKTNIELSKNTSTIDYRYIHTYVGTYLSTPVWRRLLKEAAHFWPVDHEAYMLLKYFFLG